MSENSEGNLNNAGGRSTSGLSDFSEDTRSAVNEEQAAAAAPEEAVNLPEYDPFEWDRAEKHTREWLDKLVATERDCEVNEEMLREFEKSLFRTQGVQRRAVNAQNNLAYNHHNVRPIGYERVIQRYDGAGAQPEPRYHIDEAGGAIRRPPAVAHNQNYYQANAPADWGHQEGPFANRSYNYEHARPNHQNYQPAPRFMRMMEQARVHHNMYAPRPDQNMYAPPPNQNMYAPPPNRNMYAPPPNQNMYAPRPNQNMYAPPPNQNMFAPQPNFPPVPFEMLPPMTVQNFRNHAAREDVPHPYQNKRFKLIPLDCMSCGLCIPTGSHQENLHNASIYPFKIFQVHEQIVSSGLTRFRPVATLYVPEETVPHLTTIHQFHPEMPQLYHQNMLPGNPQNVAQVDESYYQVSNNDRNVIEHFIVRQDMIGELLLRFNHPLLLRNDVQNFRLIPYSDAPRDVFHEISGNSDLNHAENINEDSQLKALQLALDIYKKNQNQQGGHHNYS